MRIIILMLSTLLLAGCAGLNEHQDLSSQALYQRGIAYTQGTEIQQDYSAGMKNFIRAGKLDHPSAQYLAGIGFYTGRGVAQDYKQAHYWFTNAALQGHPAAMNQLGDIYLNGRGLDADKSWGMYWSGLAAGLGDNNAMFVYGVGWLRGLGIPQDIRRGVFWIRLAEQHGRQNMALLLRSVKQKYPQAYKQAGKDIQNWQPMSVADSESRMKVLYIQSKLLAQGYSPGPADGEWGVKTAAALKLFCLERQQVCDTPDDQAIEVLRNAEQKQ